MAASESSADILYASGFRAPDPFVLVEDDGRRTLLLSDLEIDRGRREARADEVVSYSAIEADLQGSAKRKPPFSRVVAEFLRRAGVRRATVPADFPLGLARQLKKEKIRLRPAKDGIFPEREFKSSDEVRAISAALRIAEAGMERGITVLKESTPRTDGRLFWNRKGLTADLLRTEIEVAILRAGGVTRGDTIVACGEQTCDPHERGSGPLFANQLIILDIFPRDARTGYHGDISRTVVRGSASDEQRRVWEICLEGQKRALAGMIPGESGGPVHDAVKAFFAESGYPTQLKDGRWQGFFHGTGHGLGLDIHEEPRFSAATFQPGQVITVEPGIYLPGLGGVRHEDVALVTERGRTVLSRFPKPLEI